MTDRTDPGPPLSGHLVTVFQTGDTSVVAMVTSILEEAGIPHYAKGQAEHDATGLGRIQAGFNVLFGLIEIQVREKDADEARTLLAGLGTHVHSEHPSPEHVKYDRFCRRCRHYGFSLEAGVLCGLTGEKPAFAHACEKFEPDPEKEVEPAQGPRKKARSPGAPLLDMRRTLRGWGIGLMVLGLIHLVLRETLDPIWGGMLLVLGILNLVIRKRGLFIANGVALLVVGLGNLIGGFMPDDFSLFWAVLGGFQLVWGVGEIRKYRKYGRLLGECDFEAASSGIELGDEGNAAEGRDAERTQSRIGVSSFIISVTLLVAQLLMWTVLAWKQSLEADWPPDDSVWMPAFVLFVIVSFVSAIVAVGLGIAGLAQRPRKKTLSILGVVFSVLIAIWLVYLSV